MDKINLTWFDATLSMSGFSSGKNWGDALNPYLVKLISGKDVNFIPKDDLKTSKYLCIGSVLSYATKKTIVWGSGFIAETDKLGNKPKEIFAVRGPLTRKKVMQQGFSCPDVYGDPALLYPKFYNPDIKKKHRVGIIPHYIDRDNQWINSQKSDEILIIDILADINTVVNNIKSCSIILSSSLHGIIASDSYGVPCVWVRFSDKIVGGSFKFNDYYLSISQKIKTPFIVSQDTNIEDVIKGHIFYDVNIDLQKLMDCCPFNSHKHQISNVTSYDRYPEIFKFLSNLFKQKADILSYGCSKGDELLTLNDLYFKSSNIFGFDVDATIIKQAEKRIADVKNNENNVRILKSINDEKFDIVFVMSVLCKWTQTKDADNCSIYYSFSDFQNELTKIDSCVKTGGYLVLYNTNYLFSDTAIYDKYAPVEFGNESGFVSKFKRDGSKFLENYKYTIFYKKG